MLALATSAAAESRPEKDSNERTLSSVGQARLLGVASIIRGSELVDIGSRQPFFTEALTMEVGATNIASRGPVGVDLELVFGLVGRGGGGFDRNYWGRFELAGFTPLYRRDGPGGGSWLLGAGIGAAVGDRFWWEMVRVYPYVMSRFTHLFDRTISATVAWTCAPGDSSAISRGLWAMENRFETSLGVGLFAAGIRVGASSVVGGDPQRLYGDFEFGIFLGLGVRFQPRKEAR